jgi:hypothetical protein
VRPRFNYYPQHVFLRWRYREKHMRLLKKFIASDNRWEETKYYFGYRFRKTTKPIGDFSHNFIQQQKRGFRNSPNIVFIWIPKTAGTSVFSWLETDVNMLKLKFPAQFKNFTNRGAVTFGHVHYQSLLSAGYISESFNDQAYKFCISRNPFDRAVSLYHYLVKISLYSGEFIDFLSDVRLRRPPIGLYNECGISQANPQIDWIIDKNGEFIVDEVFSVEDMKVFEAVLRKKFNVSSNGKIQHKNKTERPVDLLRVHSEAIPMIQEIYMRDFELLGYDKQPNAAKYLKAKDLDTL